MFSNFSTPYNTLPPLFKTRSPRTPGWLRQRQRHPLRGELAVYVTRRFPRGPFQLRRLEPVYFGILGRNSGWKKEKRKRKHGGEMKKMKSWVNVMAFSGNIWRPNLPLQCKYLETPRTNNLSKGGSRNCWVSHYIFHQQLWCGGIILSVSIFHYHRWLISLSRARFYTINLISQRFSVSHGTLPHYEQTNPWFNYFSSFFFLNFFNLAHFSPSNFGESI